MTKDSAERFIRKARSVALEVGLVEWRLVSKVYDLAQFGVVYSLTYKGRLRSYVIARANLRGDQWTLGAEAIRAVLDVDTRNVFRNK